MSRAAASWLPSDGGGRIRSAGGHRRHFDMHVDGAGVDALEGDRADALDHAMPLIRYL